MAEDLFKKEDPKQTKAEVKTEAKTETKATEKQANKPVEKATAKVEEKATDTPTTTTSSAPSSSGSTEAAPADPENENQEDEDVEQNEGPKPDELSFLKKRADIMGIKYSNNIGIDALREKITAALNGEKEETKESNQKEETLKADETDNTKKKKISKKMTLRAYLQKEKMKLVRLRITNLDPKKKDLPGEILTVANEYLGTVRKFIPYGEVTDNGYHVPYCLYEQLRDRRFLNVRTRKGPHGTPIVESQMAKEFALEILPPLTAEELAKLSTAQMAAGGIE